MTEFQCSCGKLAGEIVSPKRAIRGVCYCRDCQAYAHALGRADQVLDQDGGTDVVATQAKYVSFTKGRENLACLSLTEKGLLRWYAACCKTPIANTLRNPKMPYVGFVHNCLGASEEITHAFCPRQMQLNVKSARSVPAWSAKGKTKALLKFAPLLLASRVTGGYKASPFFVAATGKPIVKPHVLSDEELKKARGET